MTSRPWKGKDETFLFYFCIMIAYLFRFNRMIWVLNLSKSEASLSSTRYFLLSQFVPWTLISFFSDRTKQAITWAVRSVTGSSLCYSLGNFRWRNSVSNFCTWDISKRQYKQTRTTFRLADKNKQMKGLFSLSSAPNWINHIVPNFSLCGSAWLLLVCLITTRMMMMMMMMVIMMELACGREI